MPRLSRSIAAAILLASAPIAASLAQGAAPPAGGTISIEGQTGDHDYDPSLRVFIDATSKALTARGFTVFEDPGHAASVLELILSHADVGTGLAKAPGQGAAIAGTGVAVPLSTGASELVSLQRTKLEMRFRRRGTTAIVWDGAAVTVREAGTKEGADAAVAALLTQALLQSYPIQPQGVLGVP